MGSRNIVIDGGPNLLMGSGARTILPAVLCDLMGLSCDYFRQLFELVWKAARQMFCEHVSKCLFLYPVNKSVHCRLAPLFARMDEIKGTCLPAVSGTFWFYMSCYYCCMHSAEFCV